MEKSIRAFERSDLEECARLFVSVFTKAPWKDNWTTESARQRLSEIHRTPGFVGLVLCEKDEIIGFALGYCEERSGMKEYSLQEMCVRNNKQRKGIGAKLLSNLQKKLKEMGVEHIYLITMKDTAAAYFYTKKGYRTNQRMIIMTHRL